MTKHSIIFKPTPNGSYFSNVKTLRHFINLCNDIILQMSGRFQTSAIIPPRVLPRILARNNTAANGGDARAQRLAFQPQPTAIHFHTFCSGYITARHPFTPLALPNVMRLPGPVTAGEGTPFERLAGRCGWSIENWPIIMFHADRTYYSIALGSAEMLMSVNR